MLILQRKPGESVMIGSDISISVISVEGGRVRLAISAPVEVPILRSELIAIQQLKAGDSVGYGSKFIAESDMRVGIVACGYADGYQRITATGTPILVDGQRSSLVGRVSMDMLAVDLSHLPNAQVGSEVVLWGTSKQGAVLSIDEVAAGSGTIGYELMCAVTARVNFIQD